MKQLPNNYSSSNLSLPFRGIGGIQAFLLLVLFAIGISANAQIRNGQQPFQTKSLAGESVKNVEVETSGGSIAVSGVDADARIEVYINRNNERSGEALTKEELQAKLDEDYDFTLSVSNGKLTAKARPKRSNMNWKQALNISFRIFVPRNISTELTTSGGSIHLDNLSGTLNFTTSGGSLHLNKLSGKVKGRTSGGGIHLNDSKDDIDLATSGGNIHATNANGNLHLATSGGSLELSDLKGDVEARTSGGNIRGNKVEGALIATTSGGNVNLKGLSCSLETATSGGHIDVSIRDLVSYVKVSNSGGDINLQIPANKGVDLDLRANKIKTDRLNNFSGRSHNDELLEGKMNGGGVPVTVRAGSGKINLSFQ